ncbi:hypothetical protein LPW26_03365 [Rhodopseudomonas sp. HC1]|uniref:hypothetical protein n=1 Tax=Rhodopseudomonas infernalis TaxID=2897386 RepID=UPI001EE8F499|nr:hypothetical protein [Rhodopseudomonas infernalis]MCG6203665.1 hypothetical protein [Rhodopseudomonas infernalis]
MSTSKSYQHIDIDQVIASCKEAAASVAPMANEDTARGVQIRLFLAINEQLSIATAREINRRTDVDLQSAGLCMLLSDIICDFAEGRAGDTESGRPGGKVTRAITLMMVRNLVEFINQRISNSANEIARHTVTIDRGSCQ